MDLTTETRRVLPSYPTEEGYMLFHSNDYLNLAQDPTICSAVIQAINDNGIGSTGSRLLSGNHCLITSLEHDLALFLNTQRCLVFNSGFQLNSGILSTFYGPKDLIIADKYIHASLIDGALLSKATFKRFNHQDTHHLAQLLATHRHNYERCIILSESLFSMTGSLADLPTLSRISSQYNADLLIDEAHSIGVCGPEGKGLCAAANLNPTFLIGTYGKAFGSSGAFIATSDYYADKIINTCRAFIYSTAPSIPSIAASHAALNRMPVLQKERNHLNIVSDYFKSCLRLHNIPFQGDAHIVSVPFSGNDAVLTKQRHCANANILVSAIRHPTVPKGHECLRFSLTAKHTHEMIDHVVSTLRT